MDIVHGAHLPFESPGLKHRGSGLEFKHLFLGTENTPENYLFTLAKQGKFYSPVHKHNFEQFGYAYRGAVSILPDMLLNEGELCYHPEGVPYGPQDDGDGERIVLVLQFGGPSGQGYLSMRQLREGQEQLSGRGRFEKGRFYANGDGDDDAEPRDGFEALWEHYNGRRLEYPPGRYKAQIMMKPENFAWMPVEGTKGGVYRKMLGVFSERPTVAEMLKIEAGARLRIKPENAIQLFFVLKGAGQVNGVDWEEQSALRLHRGEEASLSSSAGIEVLHFVLPMLSEPIQKNGVA